MRMQGAILASCVLLSGCLQVAKAASFDCAKASTGVERMICEDPETSDLDSEYGAVFEGLLARSSAKADVRSGARSWLTNVRNRCQDSGCLRAAYRERIANIRALNGDELVAQEPIRQPAQVSAKELPHSQGTAAPDASDHAEANEDDAARGSEFPTWVWVVGGIVLLIALGGAGGASGKGPNQGKAPQTPAPRITFHSEDYVVRGITRTADGWSVRYSKRSNMNMTSLLTVNRNSTGGSVGGDRYSVDWSD